MHTQHAPNLQLAAPLCALRYNTKLQSPFYTKTHHAFRDKGVPTERALVRMWVGGCQ